MNLFNILDVLQSDRTLMTLMIMINTDQKISVNHDNHDNQRSIT